MAFCSKCGKKLEDTQTFCPDCGTKVQAAASNATNGAASSNGQPVIVNIENANTNVNQKAAHRGREKNKWVSFLLCLFLGYLGAHRFYEGKIATAILYLFTGGLFGIGWIVDCWILLFKHNPYYV